MKKEIKNLISFIVNIFIFVTVLACTIWIVNSPTSDGSITRLGVIAFRYFTVDSNIFVGISSLIVAIYQFLIYIGKIDNIPDYAKKLNVVGVIQVLITFIVVIAFLGPTIPGGYAACYIGANFFFHMLIPVVAIVNLLFNETVELKVKNIGYAAFPVALYGLFYVIPCAADVIENGEIASNHDWYGFAIGGFPSILVACLAVAVLVVLLFIGIYLSFQAIRKKTGIEEKEQVSEIEISSVTAIEYYLTKVLKIICVLAPGVGICAATLFTVLTFTGNFSMSISGLIIFDCINATYTMIGLFLYKTCIDNESGMVKPNKVNAAKITITILVTLQWNLISYLAPFREFWAYCFLFVIMCILFLDSKLLLFNEITILASMILSWFIKGDVLLPARDANFTNAIVFRITSIIIVYGIIFVLSYLIDMILLKEIDRMSDYDTLTHILNRRKLGRSLNDAIGDFYEDKKDFCVAIFDIDDFKNVNDTFGHPNGDIVLEKFARIITSNVHSSDKVFRYGGEEFLILFTCTIEYAYKSCVKINNEFKATDFDFMDWHVSATGGVAQYQKGMNALDIINHADERLYIGKNSGKNKVVDYDEKEASN